MNSTPPTDLETMAHALETSGDYKVLRRLAPVARGPAPNGVQTRTAIFLDVETTGLDFTKDEIIELAMVMFNYGLDGEIYDFGPSFVGLRNPTIGLPIEITELTGITSDMLAGQLIDPEAASKFAKGADLIIAHNAAFDRPFMEAFAPEFASMPWACSAMQVPWRTEGFENASLAGVARGFGLFFDAHRAEDDARAGIEVLARRLPRSGEFAMAKLLAAARQVEWRMWAEGAPFDKKDVLKLRGYRWSDGADGRPRAWWRDVPTDQLDAENSFLVDSVYGGPSKARTSKLTACERFSAKAQNLPSP